MSSRRLTAGAKGGIGIGVAVGVAILLALAYMIFQRRQKTNLSPESKADTYDEEQNTGLPVIEEEQLAVMRTPEPEPKLHEVSLPEIGSIASFGALPGLRRKTPVPECVYMESNGRALADRKMKGSSVSTHQEALKALKALNISASSPPVSAAPMKDAPPPTGADPQLSLTTQS